MPHNTRGESPGRACHLPPGQGACAYTAPVSTGRTAPDRDNARSTAATGVVFVASFVAGMLLLGELFGAFADADRVFVEHFRSSADRARDIAGGYLLAISGGALAFLGHLISGPVAAASRRAAPLIRVTALFAGGGLFVAALAFLTVPLSIWFGDLVDDPGLQEGQAVLPQLGYVAVTVGAMLPAAAMVALVARAGGLPRWLRGISYVIAVLLLAGVFATPVALLPVWVALVSISSARG